MPGRSMVALCWMLGCVLAATAPPASALQGWGDSSEQTPADPDDAAGRAAFEREDWQGVIDHMARVIERRPADDEAHNLMGYAHRKLGHYDQALAFYDRALALNPHHRGALEYLGEAYLELDQPQLAKATLDRLAAECRRIAIDAMTGGVGAGCEEWVELNEAYDEYLAEHGGQ